MENPNSSYLGMHKMFSRCHGTIHLKIISCAEKQMKHFFSSLSILVTRWHPTRLSGKARMGLLWPLVSQRTLMMGNQGESILVQILLVCIDRKNEQNRE